MSTSAVGTLLNQSNSAPADIHASTIDHADSVASNAALSLQQHQQPGVAGTPANGSLCAAAPLVEGFGNSSHNNSFLLDDAAVGCGTAAATAAGTTREKGVGAPIISVVPWTIVPIADDSTGDDDEEESINDNEEGAEAERSTVEAETEGEASSVSSVKQRKKIVRRRNTKRRQKEMEQAAQAAQLQAELQQYVRFVWSTSIRENEDAMDAWRALVEEEAKNAGEEEEKKKKVREPNVDNSTGTGHTERKKETKAERLRRLLFVHCVRDAVGLPARFDLTASDLSSDSDDEIRKKHDELLNDEDDAKAADEREDKENERLEFYSDGGHEESIQFISELFGSYWDVDSPAFLAEAHQHEHHPIAGPQSSKKKITNAKRRKSSGKLRGADARVNHNGGTEAEEAPPTDSEWREDMMAVEQMFEHTKTVTLGKPSEKEV